MPSCRSAAGATASPSTCPPPWSRALGLREGDEIAIEVTDRQHFRIARDPRRDAALETLRSRGWSLPEGFRFDRDDAYARGA